MEYTRNSNFEMLDDFPSNNSPPNIEIKRNRYNPLYMRIPETNYTTRYNNIQDVSPNYKTDDQPHITNFEMTYPGFLESRPIQNLNTVKIQTPYTNDYNYNLNYPNTDNLYYKPHSCKENFDHLNNCPLCSSLAKTHIKLYQLVIVILILVIVFIALRKAKK